MDVRLVKDLSLHGTNVINVIDHILLGRAEIKIYDPTKVYDTGNMILYYNINTTQYEVKQSIADGVTGVYNDASWEIFPGVINSTGGIDCGSF